MHSGISGDLDLRDRAVQDVAHALEQPERFVRPVLVPVLEHELYLPTRLLAVVTPRAHLKQVLLRDGEEAPLLLRTGTVAGLSCIKIHTQMVDPVPSSVGFLAGDMHERGSLDRAVPQSVIS